jgi:hypothetical protein
VIKYLWLRLLLAMVIWIALIVIAALVGLL